MAASTAPSSNTSQIPVAVCLGEVLVDLIAEEAGLLSEAPGFRKCPGGAPANVAVGLARLGVRCGFIGKVGDDPFGDFLVATLQENGVDTGGIVRTRQAPTALAFVSLTSTGERDFFFYRNPCADLLLAPEELPTDWLRQTRFLHIGGVSLTGQPSRQATLRAAQLARNSGATVTFDPNLRLALWPGGLEECRRTIRRVLPTVDIFLPAEEELLLLMEEDNLSEAVYRAQKLGPKVICVKLGRRGVHAFLRLKDGSYREVKQPAFRVQVTDTTGAGDGFNAGLIAAMSEGHPIPEALRWGCAVAALVITKKGAMTALPTRHQLNSFLVQAQAVIE